MKTLNNQQISYVYAKNLIHAFQERGISGFVLSPGFRNSPLVLAAHQEKGAKIYSHVDERGAAFFALGLAKATKKAAVVICTSGTAAANYFPALLEAFYANIPLVVVTADRPYEMIGIGANQSMEQPSLYGNHTRLSIAIPAPVDAPECLRHLNFSADRLYAAAHGARPGPVHLNFAFREPFLAKLEEIEKIPESYFAQESSAHFPTLETEYKKMPRELLDALRHAKRACIAVGPADFNAVEKQAILGLAESTGLPLFAEASSGLVCAEKQSEKKNLFCRFDHYLRSEHFGEPLRPDLVLRFGPPLTSKFFGLATEKATQVVFDFAQEAKNPQISHSLFFALAVQDATKLLAGETKNISVDKDWLHTLHTLESQCEETLVEHLQAATDFSEWGWIRSFAKILGAGDTIFLGNSMPIRDWDSVFPHTDEEHQIFSNRGLSGIDGLLSTALGIATEQKKNTHVLIGDLSALYDLNALSLAHRLRERVNLTIWVHNNGGGEIFRIVPTSATKVPEEVFTTPQSLDFAAFAKGFQLPFLRVRSFSDLEDLGPETFSTPGIRVVELLFPAETNTALRKSFWKKYRP